MFAPARRAPVAHHLLFFHQSPRYCRRTATAPSCWFDCSVHFTQKSWLVLYVCPRDCPFFFSSSFLCFGQQVAHGSLRTKLVAGLTRCGFTAVLAGWNVNARWFTWCFRSPREAFSPVVSFLAALSCVHLTSSINSGQRSLPCCMFFYVSLLDAIEGSCRGPRLRLAPWLFKSLA